MVAVSQGGPGDRTLLHGVGIYQLKCGPMFNHPVHNIDVAPPSKVDTHAHTKVQKVLVPPHRVGGRACDRMHSNLVWHVDMTCRDTEKEEYPSVKPRWHPVSVVDRAGPQMVVTSKATPGRAQRPHRPAWARIYQRKGGLMFKYPVHNIDVAPPSQTG